MMIAGALIVWASQAVGAPVCIENDTREALFLVVDDLAGHRQGRVVTSGNRLCLEVPEDQARAMVGVFSDQDAVEGCSRLSRPGQIERLIAFAEFDNCRWAPTPRGMKRGMGGG